MNKVETAWVFMTQTYTSHDITSTIANWSKVRSQGRRHILRLSTGESDNLKQGIIAISLSAPKEVSHMNLTGMSVDQSILLSLTRNWDYVSWDVKTTSSHTYICLHTPRHSRTIRSGTYIEPTLLPSVAMSQVRETQSPVPEFFTRKFKFTGHPCSCWHKKRVLVGMESSHWLERGHRSKTH